MSRVSGKPNEGRFPTWQASTISSLVTRDFTTPAYRPFMRDLTRGRGRAMVLPSRPTVHAQLANLGEWLLGGLALAMLARGLLG